MRTEIEEQTDICKHIISTKNRTKSERVFMPDPPDSLLALQTLPPFLSSFPVFFSSISLWVES